MGNEHGGVTMLNATIYITDNIPRTPRCATPQSVHLLTGNSAGFCTSGEPRDITKVCLRNTGRTGHDRSLFTALLLCPEIKGIWGDCSRPMRLKGR
jgi:hypothetical protein